MKSSVKIDVDSASQPILHVQVYYSGTDDVRDKLLQLFISASVDHGLFLEEGFKSEDGPQQYIIRPKNQVNFVEPDAEAA
jgi:hypothetical protein